MKQTVCLILVVVSAVLVGAAGAARATSDIGYRDFDYSAPSVDNSVVGPTADKPQSKLWFNDGSWWGSLFDRSTGEYHIYRYDWATHTWSDTNTLIDARNSSRADVKWDGTHLYVATATDNSTTTEQGVYVKRYGYDSATRSYKLDSTATVATGPIEAIVLDKDTTGKLWVTYTKGREVYVNRSLGSDSTTWGTPFVLPVAGTSVTSDDISAVIAFDSPTGAPQIGVMWSNQNDGTFYFASHKDGDPDDVWQGGVAMQGNKYSDDHINLKSLKADESGRVFAVVKTSVGDVANPDSNAPLIDVLVLGTDGKWKQPVTFGRVKDDHTRPMLMIDEENRNLYVFATGPCCEGGTIYYKQASLDKVSFPEGMGTPFIQSTTDTHINNATSTKQNVNSATGLVVMASDTTSKYYLHNRMDLGLAGAAPPAPSCTITGTANAETLSGTSGDDVICAGGGNDTVNGLGGNDTLKGEAGNDTLLGEAGNDTLDGGLNIDTASYSASLTAVIASLASNTATGEGSDTFVSVENLIGSSKADTLTGSATNNRLTGGGGSDTVNGGAGNDTLIGSGGADTLNGEDGDDTINSKDNVSGNDSLDGGSHVNGDTAITDATEKSIVGFP